MSNHLDHEMQKIALEAKNDFNKQNYIEAYKKYKKIYRDFNELRVVPNLIDILFLSTKKNLLKNRNLKFKLINNLIEFGLNKDQDTSLTNELIYLKLKLFREFKFYNNFKELFLSINTNLQNIIFIQYELLHYLLETGKYDDAEDVLNKLNNNRKNYFNNIQNFSFNLESHKKLNLTQMHNKFKHNLFAENISSEFDYLVTVSSDYKIFKSETSSFIDSLNNTSANFCLVLLIHDTDQKYLKKILSELQKKEIKNYIIYFEDSKNYDFDLVETRTYFTSKRYLLVNEILLKFNKPVFLFDADSLILKDLNHYKNQYIKYDMSLHIKAELRYFDTILTANQSLFYPTNSSKIFLNFFKSKLFNTLINRKIFWQLDQVILYSSFIFIKRYYQVSIHNNSINTHKNVDSYFYHTFHNKYLL